MYLEKLEAQGFKSFAQKNVLVFPGMLGGDRRGITAIVGPNGSGKSNVADSVRWVLGEQSMKTLRGKRSEDVIFSGSAKLGKLGMAEVSLFLNNEDGKAPIDYSQVVLTRRLFRDGNSEYLINNNRVRLSDIQILLAKASFGQRTYSVIGQGMVEGFLNTSLGERKEFFDEATGIKQYQIKRDEALNKLLASYENLGQAQMILSEIEPRLKSLTKQVNRLQRRGEIEAELQGLHTVYYRQLWHEINEKLYSCNKQVLELETSRQEKEKKLYQLNSRLSQLERQKSSGDHFNELQAELAKLQNQKDSLNKQIARIDAELELKLEASGEFDLSWLKNKQQELTEAAKLNNEELAVLGSSLEKSRALVNGLREEQSDIIGKIRNLNNGLIRTNSKLPIDKINQLNDDLLSLFSKLESAEQLADLEQVRAILSEIKSDLQKILNLSGGENNTAELERAQKQLLELAMRQEELSLAINEKSQELYSQSERHKLLGEKKHSLNNELNSIAGKLAARSSKVDHGQIAKDREGLLKELAALEGKIAIIKAEVNQLSVKEAEGRSQLFEIQKNIQVLQQEINQVVNSLNDIKISSTRFETRLEDLEQEIRRELGRVKEIRDQKNDGHVEMDPLAEKIRNLKRQLDHIGGIDPEVEKEFNETRDRHDYLSGQTNDLDNTIGSLEKIIKELDVIIKEKFDKEFKVISAKFEEYFRILFNGGQAKIIKVMEGDEEMELEKLDGAPKPAMSEDDKSVKIKRIKYLQKHNATGLAGIEIQATPPGKKIKSVTMLSGGERALTAIALICAIINVNPSPFVVLDEVDAALDEANSERLAKILDDLSHKTQFIVITHNRASMRRANVLYGVTMGDDGVSKLLSIKLDEAEARVRSS